MARAHLISGIATGLQAYYGWTLVCDVDEFIIPHPSSDQTFQQALGSADGNILLSRGFDVLQADDEAAFDVSLSILNQRRFATPNTAICKPHLARAPIRYSGGYHYCQERLDFAPPNSGFLTLHLKWACAAMRAQVFNIVAETKYASTATAEYSAKSVAADTRHFLASPPHFAKAMPLASPPMERFEEEYRARQTYSATRKLWLGEHRTASFLVNFRL